jgi:hypothetical protein|nr:hypothetical protein [uncultured Oscillibacter sp.]
MGALTNVRDTAEVMNGGRQLVLPVKAKTTIYQGALVTLDADGFAVPGKKAVGLTSAGRAEETVENAGGDGDLVIRVTRGVFIYSNTSTAANKVTAAHVLKPCYIQDDQTVTALGAGASVAGLVVRVDENGVAVEIGTGLTAPAASTGSGS